MGDRGNIIVEDDGSVFLYTHWSGSDLPKIVAHGLDRGRGRWNDGPYLTRILFCELVPQSEWAEETGYGISTVMGDGGKEVIVNIAQQSITDDDGVCSFEEYITKHKT